MSIRKADPIPPNVRAAEKQIDNAFRSNALTKLPFAESAYYTLTALEHALRPDLREFTLQSYSAYADRQLNALTHAMFWLWEACRRNGSIPKQLEPKKITWSYNLLDLAQRYDFFNSAYVLASRGAIQISLKGQELIPDNKNRTDAKYEAYNRLTKPDDAGVPYDALSFVAHEARESMQWVANGVMFSNPAELLKLATGAIRQALEPRFSLPRHWQTTRYSFENFLKVYTCLCAMAIIQQYVRSFITENAGEAIGDIHAVKIISYTELILQIKIASELDGNIISDVVKDLTYGSRGIRIPDILLQPLVLLNQSNYVITPNLLINSSAERNLTSLLNKIEEEKGPYSRLVNEKEVSLRKHIQNELSGLNLAFFHGRLSDVLPDVDLAIIDHNSHLCLLLELKWFIAPAEPREVLERREELAKGIQQALKILNATTIQDGNVLHRLGVDDSYIVSAAVVSQNWIGYSDVQDHQVPIIKSDHLIDVIRYRGLKYTIDWLLNGSFLPREGVDYEVVDVLPTIGRWSLQWYGIRPLLSDRFWPV